jgi:hypothetical protein
LKGEGLVDYIDFGGQVAVTHLGVIQVEEALSKPDNETKYFPAVKDLNINIIHTMINSSIKQNSPHAKQIHIVNQKNIKEIAEINEQLKQSLDNIGLDAESRSDLKAETQRIDTELSLSKPKHQILSDSLSSAIEILEKVANISNLAMTLINKVNNSFSL